MKDPQFPNRPDHPDFWLLAEAVIESDAQSARESVTDVIARYADAESVIYMAEGRARLMFPGSGPTVVNLRAKFVAVWLDSFLAGMKFQSRKLPTVKDGQQRLF